MLRYERQKQLLDMFTVGEVLHPEDIVNKFGVSLATARRDLKLLEELPYIQKVYGGAVKLEIDPDDTPLLERQHLNVKEKDAIGRWCANLVQDNDLIMLDNGTTPLYIARYLKERDITVLTNSLLIVNELASARPEVILLGGTLRKKELSITGYPTLNELKSYNIGKYFMSVSGLSPDTGVSDYHIDEIEVKKNAIACSRDVYLISDSSKFGFVAPRHLCRLDDVSMIITDNGLADAAFEEYKNAGATIHRVEIKHKP